ncbi:MAG: biliverdin-producing heme oxygenase [Terriglobus roseus]|nr:biliverdin-producing heme oxygenase [Terriglobus roseus]
MDLKLLREATRPEHEATETAVALTGPGMTREAYISTLQRFHGVVCAWDKIAAAEAPAAYADLVRQRRRCGSLEEDLRFFGAPAGEHASESLLGEMRALIGNPEQGDAHQRDSRFLGAMYVVEGSTLGGQYIAHQVETDLNLQPGQGDRFFRGYGKETMPKWREFQQVLAALPEPQTEHVIAAAKAMFGIFRSWLAPAASSNAENLRNSENVSGERLPTGWAEAS